MPTKRKRSDDNTTYVRRTKARKFKGIPYKAKYKNAKYRYVKSRQSKRKWLLKRARKSKLMGTYKPKTLFNSKDSFSPVGQLRDLVVLHKLPYRPQKLPAHLASQQLVMRHKWSGHYTSNVGRQEHHCHMAMTNDYMQFPMTSTDHDIPNMWAIAMGTAFNWGNYQSTVDPTAAGSGVPSLEAMRRQALYVKSYRCSYTLVNPTNADLHLTIYHIRFRKDMPVSAQDPSSHWNQLVLNADNSDSSAFTVQGFAPYNSAMNANTVGVKPMSYVGFNKMYGVSHIKNLVLKPGQTLNHNVHVKYNKYMNWEDVYYPKSGSDADSQGVSPYMAKWTHATMFVYRGPVAEDTSTSNVVTYAPTTLNIFHEETVKFYLATMKPQTVFMRNDINTSVAPSTLRTVQEDGDIVAPQEAAQPSSSYVYAQTAAFATPPVAGQEVIRTEDMNL